MNFSHRSNRALRMLPALRCGHQQALGQCLEIEPAIEPVGKNGQVLLCIFSESEAVVAATEAGLEVSQHRVNPLQFRHVLGLTPCDHSAFMGTAGLRHGAQAHLQPCLCCTVFATAAASIYSGYGLYDESAGQTFALLGANSHRQVPDRKQPRPKNHVKPHPNPV